jgi:16S rRNA G966 N2-methylase RsmD
VPGIGYFDCYEYYYNSLETRLGKKNLLSDLILQNKMKKNNLCVLDMFAGFGRDSFNFLYYNCHVTAIEVNAYIFVVLSYLNELYYNNFNKKLTLVYMSAYDFLATINYQDQYNIIYIDPMFEEKKNSSLPAKDMQIISYFNKMYDYNLQQHHQLVILQKLKNVRIIVKRDNKQPYLFDQIKPNFSKLGKCIRFDVYNINSV